MVIVQFKAYGISRSNHIFPFLTKYELYDNSLSDTVGTGVFFVPQYLPVRKQ